MDSNETIKTYKCCKCERIVPSGEYVGNNHCAYCEEWNTVINMYRHVYREDPYWQKVLDLIERTVYVTNFKRTMPSPYRFKQLLEDRGIEVNRSIIGLWNMCRDEGAQIPRWDTDELNTAVHTILNKIAHFRL